MADALTYNKQQGFSRAETAFIQRVVGSNPDGQWGPSTVTAIQSWQAARKIPADGKVWRSTSGDTWPQLLSTGAAGWATATPKITRVGLWTFSDALMPTSSACSHALELAVEAGLTDVVFTLDNDTDTTFELPTTIANIVESGKAYKDKGIDVSLNAFIYPSSDYVTALTDAVLQIDHQLGLRRLDIDAEELWIKHADQAAKDSAAELFGQQLRGAPLFVAINGIVYTKQAALDPLVKQSCVTHVTPQAYSVANKTSSDGKPNATYNPIDLQTTAHTKWAGWWPDRKIIGGFATYNQAGRYELGTLSEDVAIGLALQTWADLGVTEVCGWSIKQVSSVTAALLRQRCPVS
ncbi:hypothetical protein DB30_07126 [Enhygromyxa salina]|uniref:Peptidoglycan binding-like domain-containing protein n=1 Tax=Enhygromyxa salina TaxID=215803 RepID=A0A0C2CWX9_9BACT|nr:peptidoglycan-binding domain-containing protein [Enhygromyxa salina]KIG14130.1 hypothetical protein DB30_07126 [Enhygromyxa salina]